MSLVANAGHKTFDHLNENADDALRARRRREQERCSAALRRGLVNRGPHGAEKLHDAAMPGLKASPCVTHVRSLHLLVSLRKSNVRSFSYQ